MFVTHGEPESVFWLYKDISATVITHLGFNQDTRAGHEAEIYIVNYTQLSFIHMLFFLVSVNSVGANWIREIQKSSLL